MTNLTQFRDAAATDLPMGAQKLLEVVRALMAEPRLLLLDEPAAGLNDAETADLAELLRAVRDGGVTVMVVEHNMSLVMGVADEVIVLDAGSIVARGSAARDPEERARHRRLCRSRRLMLEVKRLHTGYGGMDVIHGIDIEVRAGEIVALVGANGAGKSTLVKTISGLLPVRAGEILFEGERIDRLSPKARVLRGIAQVPEGRQVFAGLSVSENLRLGAYVHRHTLGQAELEARMREVCALFPVLLERLGEPVGNLSGGQQQMLVIARGLMAQPRLLVLDEPSLGLAPVLVVEIFRLIAGLRDQGIAILLSEQNAKLSLAIADRAYVIEMGRVALAGTGKELLASPEVAERYLGVGHAVSVADAPRHAQLVARLKEIFGSSVEQKSPSS